MDRRGAAMFYCGSFFVCCEVLFCIFVVNERTCSEKYGQLVCSEAGRWFDGQL
jgi:hypothetical protein